jgi:predicted small integral membrane protein
MTRGQKGGEVGVVRWSTTRIDTLFVQLSMFLAFQNMRWTRERAETKTTVENSVAHLLILKIRYLNDESGHR